MVSRNFRDLIAWRKAMDLVVDCYRLTKGFPKEEIYGLTNQLRRAAISIPSNIAEGEGRGGKVEFSRFLHIAHGSLRELETQLTIASRLEYITTSDLQIITGLTSEVGRLINGLLRSLR